MSPIVQTMNKNIQKNPFCSAMAGIKTLHYIDIKNIATFFPSGDGLAVTLKAHTSWTQVQFTQASCDVKPDGDAFLHTINATVPGKGTMSARDLMELRYGRYLVRVTDNNGVRWMCGDTDEGLQLSYEEVNEGSADGETAYRITISGLSMWPQMVC